MTTDISAVRVGLTGAFSKGPSGTAAPTDATTAINVAPAAATGQVTRCSSAFASSCRQRSSGPTAITTTSSSAIGPVVLSKNGLPTDSCTPIAAAASG